MHHQRIALTSLPLLQRQQPIWHLCHTRRNTRSRWCMQPMLFLPRWHRKLLGGGENSPHQSNLFGADRTWCYVVTHSPISQTHLALKPYEQRVQTMNKLMVWCQRRAGLADGAVIFCGGHSKN
jgi:hypothetical protein